MGQGSTRWATGIWLLLCAGLGGIVALQLSSSLPLAPQVTAALPGAPLPEPAAEPAAFEPPPRSAFDEIAERPLFAESRRPYVPDRPPAAAPVEEREEVVLELVGTLLTGQNRAALVKPEGQSARWLRSGQAIGGWQVEAIERDRITLRLDDEARTLQLRADLMPPAQPAQPVERRRNLRPERPGERDQEAQDEASADEPADPAD